jgi:UDP:flavonoid glycosyltransferase YjiC (YdhE family)
MKISILALGSTGDILPLAALGKGLQQAGHRVRLVSFENYREAAASRDMEFHPVRGDGQALTLSAGGLNRSAGSQNVLKTWLGVRKTFGAQAEEYARAFSSPDLGDSDLIINQLPGGLFGMDLAEKLNVPMLLAAVIPMARTRDRPMVPFPDWLSFFPGYNRLTYRAAESLVWAAFRRVINRWRVEVLQLPRKTYRNQFSELGTIHYPILNGFSPAVVPRPEDWGDNIHLTGWWFPEPREWSPPRELVRFLEAGPAPVFIGFGSMPLPEPAETLGVILESLQKTRMRAVLHRGWGGLEGDALPPSIHIIDYAPYDWLFPRMAALVHHGGSGTTGFALRSGIPSLVIPFVFDQFFWGKRVYQLGAGPQPIPITRLTEDKLTVAIQEMIHNPVLKQRARDLGEEIAGEIGVQNAVEIIDRYLTGL